MVVQNKMMTNVVQMPRQMRMHRVVRAGKDHDSTKIDSDL
jgi:hypothetical protein